MSAPDPADSSVTIVFESMFGNTRRIADLLNAHSDARTEGVA